jgi:sugar O-acyltransferase (sialic acid O-acetyltransferase NeuD family)
VTDAYVIWGSAGHAKVLASLIALHGHTVVALVDNRPDATAAVAGVPLLIGEAGLRAWRRTHAPAGNLYGIAAIGGTRGRDRLAIHAIFRAHQIQVAPPLIHPHASVCSTAQLGPGTQVLAQAVVAAEACIGEACILNHRANADHECVLGDGVHLAPGATLCGCVTLGEHVMIGAGAVILPRLSIGADTVVGAGAVVTRPLPAGVVAIGSPARVRRHV